MVPNIKEENVKAISRKDRIQQLNIKCDRTMRMARNLATSTFCASAIVQQKFNNIYIEIC